MSTAVDPHVIGDHVRRLRSERRTSVRAFAAETGFSASFISQLENGQVSPSLGSLHKIAEALGVTLGEFFAAAETGEEPLVVRAEERPRLDSTWTDAHIEALGLMKQTHRLEPIIAIFGTGGKSGKRPHDGLVAVKDRRRPFRPINRTVVINHSNERRLTAHRWALYD
jgi:transcriptional regulator with XRE-family HTH domain